MRKRRWKAGEIVELSRRYEAEGPARLAVDLQRTVDSVTSQANRLRMRSLSRRARQALSRKKLSVASSGTAGTGVESLVEVGTVPAAYFHDPQWEIERHKTVAQKRVAATTWKDALRLASAPEKRPT